jgi:hypothetical protein
MLSLFAQADTGSVIVAVTLIVLVGVVIVVAMFRYPKIEDILKLWGALGTIIGLIVGSMGAYFFTRAEVQKAVAVAESGKEVIIAQKNALSEQKETLQRSLAAAQTTASDLRTQLARAKATQQPGSIDDLFSHAVLAKLVPRESDVSFVESLSRLLVTKLDDKDERSRFDKIRRSISEVQDDSTKAKLLRSFVVAAGRPNTAERSHALEALQSELKLSTVAIAKFDKKDDTPPSPKKTHDKPKSP